jgi:hypothetical protein
MIPDTDWIEWAGGECPVAGDTLVEWMLRGERDGQYIYNSVRAPAQDLDWDHLDLSGIDIVAYRVVVKP